MDRFAVIEVILMGGLAGPNLCGGYLFSFSRLRRLMRSARPRRTPTVTAPASPVCPKRSFSDDRDLIVPRSGEVVPIAAAVAAAMCDRTRPKQGKEQESEQRYKMK